MRSDHRMRQAENPKSATVAPENADGEIRRAMRFHAAEIERLKHQLGLHGERDPLDERDDLIRGMRTHYDRLAAHGAAKALEREWESYLSRQWLRERDLATLPKASAHRRALHRISKLNRGAALCARQLTNIFDGLRDS
jgi:hypothetical protein